jgi:glutathione S-transferase
MGLLNDAGSFAATLVRLGRGLYPKVTAADRESPAKLLELYDYEGCPYCRKVREVLCELDLDYLSHPVAHGSPRRDELKRLGGKIQVPFLVDPNTATRMYESDDIIDYLNETYGGGRRAGWALPLPSLLDDVDSALASAVRLARGTRCRDGGARNGVEPLTLYNMEGSPYCRKVREALTELDLEYVVKNMPKGSPKRAELIERGGKFQVPYVIDPNTAMEMYESDDIIGYLDGRYGAGRGSGERPGKTRKARSRAGVGG